MFATRSKPSFRGAVSGLIRLRALLGSAALLLAGVASAATITVNTTASADLSDGACSLREAMIAINQQANYLDCSAEGSYGSNDRIEFAIPGNGLHTIVVSTDLPAIIRPVTIDGLTQSGASCTSWPPTLLIELDGQGSVFRGLRFEAGSAGSLVRGLIIGGMANAGDNFSAGIALRSDGNRVECNYIGMRADGVTANPNRRGIDINSSNENIIGTDGIQPALGRRNLISGNIFSGVNTRGIAPSRNIIAGNYIGVDVSGTESRSNTVGVTINAGPGGPALDNVVGYNGVGTPEFARNVISGNVGTSFATGLDIVTNAQRTRIAGNYFGLSADGTAAVPNRNGLSLGSNATVLDNLIGFPSAQPLAVSGNVISGNQANGIFINGFNGTDRTFIVGNLIGTFPNGAAGLPNGSSGITLSSNTRALVNGNVISGQADGIWLNGSSGRPLPRFLNNEPLPTGGDPLDSSGNCLTDNTIGARLTVNGGNATSIIFGENWWGAADGPGGSGPGNGDPVSSGITFTPFLTTAPTGCAAIPLADLSIDIGGVPNPLAIGTSFDATVEVTNAGPDPVADASLRFTTPSPLDLTLPPGCTTENDEIVCAIGPVASGATVSRDVPLSVPDTAVASFVSTFSVTSSVLDPNAGNNSVIVSRAIQRLADLSVTMSSDSGSVFQNEIATYRILVANAGPSPVDGAEVMAEVPAGTSEFAWTCTGTGGASCTGSGSGPIDETVTLPAGGEVLFVVTGLVSKVSTLALTASVTPPVGALDTVTDNNQDMLEISVLPARDDRIFSDRFAAPAGQ